MEKVKKEKENKFKLYIFLYLIFKSLKKIKFNFYFNKIIHNFLFSLLYNLSIELLKGNYKPPPKDDGKGKKGKRR